MEGGATPLRPGDVLAGHYEILEVVESSPDSNTYRARDRQRCPACGCANEEGETYCRECGSSLEQPCYVTVVERLRIAPERYDERFEDGDRDYFVTVELPPSEGAPLGGAGAARMRLIWGRATDRGQQRDLNEDHLEVWLYARGSGGLLGLFVVADGLGGQDSGEVASSLATDTVWQSLRESVWEPVIRGQTLAPDELEARLARAMRAASQAVYEARLARNSEMSTTLTLALVVDDTTYVGNVGDSRTYIWNAKGLRRITRDHSLVQRLVDTGQIEPRDVYAHPQRNLIYQSVGDAPDVRPDVFREMLAPDDRLILCSDGLWEMVRDEGIDEVLLAEPDPQRACERLVRDANMAGGEDNISVIIVQACAA
jgi:serine/threonine protein phosphatase PrpC